MQRGVLMREQTHGGIPGSFRVLECLLWLAGCPPVIGEIGQPAVRGLVRLETECNAAVQRL
jgi:hypothetical protein